MKLGELKVNELRNSGNNGIENNDFNCNTVFHLSPLGMFTVSIKNEMFVDANEVFMEATGFTKEQILNMSAADHRLWVKDNDFLQIKRLIAYHRYVRNYKTKIRLKDMIRDVLLSATIVWWNNELCTLVVANDITEIIQYRQEISRLDRLNIIGEIAAGIAHEVRNPMTTVKGFLQLMRCNEKYDEDFESLDLMIEEMDRANNIFTEFLSLAKNKEIDLKKGDLNKNLELLKPLMQAEATMKDICIEMDLHQISDIMFDGMELRQLVLNLVMNGMDAMPNGGTLMIMTSEDQYGINLIIQDHGMGIPAEAINIIGTPFFTTKERGTGLGLAVCYRIVERHNAYMEFDTGPNETTFTVTFPSA